MSRTTSRLRSKAAGRPSGAPLPLCAAASRAGAEASGRTNTRQLPVVTGVLLLSAVVIFLVPGAARALEYDRAALGRGEFWRIVTCHGTHFSFDHLFWDVFALGIVGALCEARSRRQLIACVALAAFAIPAGVWLWRPGMATYRGLSGIDSAVFALAAVGLVRDARRTGERRRMGLAGFASAAFVGKIAYELFGGSAVFVEGAASGMVPVPLAHAVGAAVGALTGLGDVLGAGGRRGWARALSGWPACR